MFARIRQFGRRSHQGLLRTFSQKVPLGLLLRRVGAGPQWVLGQILYWPAVAGRRALQLFLRSVSSTRHVMHLFVILAAFVLVLTGLVDRPVFGNDEEAFNQYVTPFAGGVETASYAAQLDSGFLAKPSTVNTDIRAKRTEGIIEYTVLGGDTAGSIAKKFGISLRTLQWLNQIQDVSRLKPGQKLTILPTSGVLHKVAAGENVNAIAEKYGANAADLIASNDLVAPVKLIADQEIVVPLPDNLIPEMPKPEPPKVVASNNNSNAGSSSSVSSSNANVGSQVGSGQFIWPTTGKLTQYSRAGHVALDIASRALPAIYAADDGVVTLVAYTNVGYGRYLEINHGNGFVTRYAHNTEMYVTVGQSVSKGQVIAKMGCTGRCTGPHLHFEIILNGSQRNPLEYL